MPCDFPAELPPAALDRPEEAGCAFVIEEAGANAERVTFCEARRQPGSAYCPLHHARCRLAGGSAGEQRQLREIEALAAAVGGKQGRSMRRPPAGLLRRLDRVTRAVLRPDSSCFVRERDDDSATSC